MKSSLAIRCLILSLLILGLSLCQAAPRPKYLALTIGSKTFGRIELALTEEEVRKGLMFRDSLPSDGGMIFVFSQEEPLAFWMKNTRIPLDILYLNTQGIVVSIHTMSTEMPAFPGETPLLYELRLPTYPSVRPAQFAIELNAGEARNTGVNVGDSISLNPKYLLRLLQEARSQR